MYPRVTTFTVEPAKLDAFAGRVRETVAPAVTQQRGHRVGLLLTDPATGKMLGLLLGAVPGSAVQETYEVSVRTEPRGRPIHGVSRPAW